MNITVAGSLAAGSYRTAERAAVVTGRATPGSGTRRAIFWGHGAGGTFNSFSHADARVFAEAGYPFITADIGNHPTYGGFTFGNDDSITSLGSLWTWAKTAAGGAKTDKFCVNMVSMMSQTFLAWAIQAANAGLVQAAALVIGALDIDDAYQNDIGGLRATIGTAHGVAYPTAIPNLATHSPAAFSNANKAKLTFPLKLWTSDDDIFTTTAEAQAWAASVNAQTGLGNVTVESMGSLGHAANVTAEQVLAFYDANGGRA